MIMTKISKKDFKDLCRNPYYYVSFKEWTSMREEVSAGGVVLLAMLYFYLENSMEIGFYQRER